MDRRAVRYGGQNSLLWPQAKKRMMAKFSDLLRLDVDKGHSLHAHSQQLDTLYPLMGQLPGNFQIEKWCPPYIQ